MNYQMHCITGLAKYIPIEVFRKKQLKFQRMEKKISKKLEIFTIYLQKEMIKGM